MNRTGPDDAHLDPFDGFEAEAVEVLPSLAAALPEERPPAAVWERISAAVALERSGASSRDADAFAPEVPREARVRPAYFTFRRFAAAAVLAVVAGLGAFAALQSASVGSLVREQRVLAVWMSDPDMRLIALRAPASGLPAALAQAAEAWDDADYDPSQRLGILCVLPDGRALVFQPERAPRGSEYVVLGQGPAGEVELARGSGNLLRFMASDISSVRVRLLTASGESLPVAWAVVN